MEHTQDVLIDCPAVYLPVLNRLKVFKALKKAKLGYTSKCYILQRRRSVVWSVKRSLVLPVRVDAMP